MITVVCNDKQLVVINIPILYGIDYTLLAEKKLSQNQFFQYITVFRPKPGAFDNIKYENKYF